MAIYRSFDHQEIAETILAKGYDVLPIFRLKNNKYDFFITSFFILFYISYLHLFNK